jgi:ferredoxin
MKIEIDLLSCKDFGECVTSAPNLFRLDANGKQSLRHESRETTFEFDVAEEFETAAEEATIVCPMQALTILS